MTKDEFESRIGREVSVGDYKEIEYVYTWHPAIKDVEGKDQIAAIFNAGGMMVIRSMKEAAVMAEAVEEELRSELRKVEILKGRLQRLKNGDTRYERCIKDAFKVLDRAETPEMFEMMMDDLTKEYGYEVTDEARENLDFKLSVVAQMKR